MTTASPPWSHQALTPLALLERSAVVHRDRVAVVDRRGDDVHTTTYAELADRTGRLGAGLRAAGLGPGHRVAVLAPNVAATLDAHFGVPASGAALVALNTRLGAGELGYILEHCGAGLLLVDHELAGLGADAVTASGRATPVVIAGGPDDGYERLLDTATAAMPPAPELDELGLLAVNYTSGTTGHPKGVMYHHRGAYLQSLAMAHHLAMDAGSVLLWTLPMFHCNGWCLPWTGVAVGARQILLRRPDPDAVWAAIRDHGVTHLNAAPTVLAALADSPEAGTGVDGPPVRVGTGGAPPSPTLLARLGDLGFAVTHLYGLTETFGPVAVCDPHPEWAALDVEALAERHARQGVGNIVSGRLRVVDADGRDVPADGVTLGELTVRGNTVMLGYLHDPEATRAACPDGSFHTGDLGVVHADGYVELKDRAKDIVISGGENISSVEVEQALLRHPAVADAAVVAGPDDRWGEVPVAFVTVRPGAAVDPEALRDHVRAALAGFKVPKRIVFADLPRTATGKVQKFELRQQLWRDQPRRVH